MSKKETLETEETVKEETVTEEETQKAAEENIDEMVLVKKCVGYSFTP